MTDEAIDPNVARARLLRTGGRFAFPVPDALMAVLLALAALTDFLSPEQLSRWPMGFLEARQELVFALIVEGGFLLMQGTLVDIATRLKKRPPVWAIALIVVGVVLFNREALDVLRMAWARGAIVFLPLLVSLAQRATILWHMPNRSHIEKIAARALVSNRITTGLALAGLVTVAMLLGAIWPDTFPPIGNWQPLAAGAVYFAVAAYDDARVRGRKFAENPRVLFGWDPLGIKYLEAL